MVASYDAFIAHRLETPSPMGLEVKIVIYQRLRKTPLGLMEVGLNTPGPGIAAHPGLAKQKTSYLAAVSQC